MEKYLRARQTTDDNTAHAHCMLVAKGYKPTHRICNTFCFSTAAMVAGTHLNVTLHVHCLSGVPRNFVRGVQQIQLRKEDREKGDLGGGSPLVRGSGGSCNLVQEISFRIAKFS